MIKMALDTRLTVHNCSLIIDNDKNLTGIVLVFQDASIEKFEKGFDNI